MGSIVTPVSNDTDLSTPTLPFGTHCAHGHGVQFYQQDAALLDNLSHSIGAAIVGGDSAMVIATKSHRDGLMIRLKERGLDPTVAVRQGRFLSLDADEVMARFMVGDQPDASLFNHHIGSLIIGLAAAARGEHPRVAAFGEMVALLWAEGRRDAALRMEQLWNELAVTHSFHLHCAYAMDLFAQESDGQHIRDICALHSHILPTEQYTSASGEQDRLRAIVLLQQKARALETEIRERNKAEEASSRLAAIVESSDDAIVGKDLNGVINSWNKGAERIFGYTAQEIIGRPITLLIPSELQVEEERILAKIRAGERIEHFQTMRLTKSGECIDASVTISPVRDRYGKIIGAAKILRDITQKKKLEAALHTTERLAAVGRLAASVAHEINNPLESVVNFIYLARQQPDISEETSSYLISADREIARVAHLAQKTLGFYRDNSHPASLAVATVVDDVLSIYASRIQYKSLCVETRIEPQLMIFALQGELKQILSNLLANSIDACDTGGRIIIAGCTVHGLNSHTGGVRLIVADNGAGISHADRQKVFEPFYTTKNAVGTGLGLWITKDLMERRGGSIRFYSSMAPGRSGTVMRLFLPSNIPQS